MAGDWIKVQKKLLDSPKIEAIARRLRISKDAVLGKIIRLWAWADTHAREERVPWLNGAWIDDYVEQSGFSESVVLVGWIELTPTGIRFVDFGKHNWQGAKEKALSTDRQRKRRDALSRSCHAPTVTEALPLHYTTLNTPPNPPQGGSAEADDPPPAKPLDKVLLTFPCLPGKAKGPREWHFTESKRNEYAEAYPGVNIDAEARKALQWVRDHAARMKTHQGMPAFLNGWFAREQNRGPKPHTTHTPRPSRTDTITDLFEGAKNDLEGLG